MPARSPTAVFVYGTLKRGQCREALWPRKPASVQIGWCRGTLFDRHDYPAMTSGERRVLGELWSFDTDAMPLVLETLDEIEGTGQADCTDLYFRVLVEIYSIEDQSLGDAYTYRYATDPTKDGFTRMSSASDADYVSWPPT